MRTRRLRTVGAIAVTAVMVVTGLQIATAGSAGAATVSHTFSDPVWFPVRDVVQIACVGNGSQAKNNNYSTADGHCDGDHAKYFAMNIDAIKGQVEHPAVYAAGAGVVISADDSPGTCGGTNHAGKTVEISHGGGVVSVYEHLQTITVRKGAHVTPSTQIGTMGHSGQKCTATVNYLDFQIQRYGATHLNTDTVSIKTMRGCSGATEQTWPADLVPGSPATWVKVPYKTHIDTSGGTCYPTGTGDSPAKPAKPKVTPLHGRATVSWNAGGANKSIIQLEIYRNGKGWEAPCSPYRSSKCTSGYTAVSSSKGKTTLTGLTNGREYRLRVSRHNSNGWSPASAWASLTEPPLFRKFRTTTSLVEIYWSMYRPTKLKTGKIEHFQIAVRSVKHGNATAWKTYRTKASATNFTVKAHRRTQYQMKVRALTNAGPGGWMKVHKVTTP